MDCEAIRYISKDHHCQISVISVESSTISTLFFLFENVMLRKLVQTLIVISLSILMSPVLAADVGYITHRFVNNTANECYISVRQQYSYPIDTCLGPVAGNANKTCDGSFAPHQPNFLFMAICNGTPQRQELNKLVFLKNTYKSQTIEVVWTVDMIKKKLHVSYREHGL